MLPETDAVPFNDLAALKTRLSQNKYAAFLVEPLQSEAGIRIPASGYLSEAQELCRRYGTLLVFDEVQTGLFRTGHFLAAHHFAASADIVILAKALSGGLIPVSATLMSDRVYDSVYDFLERSIIHTSTFSENSLAMRAGLATLDVLERERLGQRALDSGEYLRQQLTRALSHFPMVRDIRGLGMLSGIEFQPPPQKLAARKLFEALHAVHAGMFGQVIVMRLFRDWNILTQMCGNNFMVLKVAPPLIVSADEIDRFVEAITEVVTLMHSPGTFWTEALGLARRAANV